MLFFSTDVRHIGIAGVSIRVEWRSSTDGTYAFVAHVLEPAAGTNDTGALAGGSPGQPLNWECRLNVTPECSCLSTDFDAFNILSF